MDPITLATIGIPALFNLGKSLFGAGQLAKNKRPVAPKYEIPSAVQNYLNRLNIKSHQGLPGQDIIEGKIGAQVANSIGDVNRSASSSASALGAVTDINQRAIDAVRDVGFQSAQYRDKNQDRAIEGERYKADYQEKAWEYNQNIPYQQKMNEFMANKQAGNANLWGGLEGIGSNVVGGLGYQNQSNMMQGLIDAIKGGQMDMSDPFVQQMLSGSLSKNYGLFSGENLGNYGSFAQFQHSKNKGF